MSVQLIVYPQNFNGTYNEISSSSTEFLVNGLNFNNLDSTVAYTSSVLPPYVDTLTNSPTTIPNTWYRFRNNTGGTPDYPSTTAADLILKSVAGAGSVTGIYQRLTNLVIGQQYTITINLSAATTGTIITQIANGTTIYSGGGGAANVTQITDNFIAQSTDSTVMIAYINFIVATATITDLSVQPVVGAVPSGATNFLDNGQVICDLYEDEDLPLSLSVDDFKNVAEKVQSYSKAFNLPSTKRNNRIFNAIFEITRSNDGLIFNPYKKTKCVLKQDGFILFEGYLRLLDVTDKEGEISYNVNLYSEVIALADYLKDLDFRALDFTELVHAYNKIQIKASWNDSPASGITYTNPNTSGFRDANNTVKYPFVDWTHQILVGGSNGTSATVGNPEFTSLEQIFRPFINVKYLIDRIFEATPFTYESTFFATADFKKLYMDFNWGSSRYSLEPTQGKFTNTSAVHLSTTSYTNYILNDTIGFSIEVNYDSINNRFVALNNDTQYNISPVLTFQAVGTPTAGMNARIAHRDSTGVLIQDYDVVYDVSTVPSYFVTRNVVLQQNDTLQIEWKSDVAGEYMQSQSGNVVVASTGGTLITTNIFLQTLRGETGQWDFLKGLITMFNLVTLPDEDNPNNIIIEPYSDVFINSTDSVQLDWTEKIDVSEMKLTPLTDLVKKTIFKFEEDDDDYAFDVYKKQVGGHLYGSKEWDASNEFNILDGEEEIVATPFAATVVKPLMSQFPSFITPAIYADGGDGVWEGFENSPRIMFNNGIKSTGASYYIPAQNGGTSANETNFLQFSHLTDIPTIVNNPPVSTDTRDFHFGECQLMTGDAPTPNNLFNLYWFPYFSELYNPNTRTMTIKVNLSPADINTFKFNSKIFIKNRIFRVNKIDYKPNDLATVEFILIP